MDYLAGNVQLVIAIFERNNYKKEKYNTPHKIIINF